MSNEQSLEYFLLSRPGLTRPPIRQESHPRADARAMDGRRKSGHDNLR
jgi:hypothetical protein